MYDFGRYFRMLCGEEISDFLNSLKSVSEIWAEFAETRKVSDISEETSCNIIIYSIFINCNWVVTRWQHTFTHKQYTEQHK
jgi:hypothetical protein